VGNDREICRPLVPKSGVKKKGLGGRWERDRKGGGSDNCRKGGRIGIDSSSATVRELEHTLLTIKKRMGNYNKTHSRKRRGLQCDVVTRGIKGGRCHSSRGDRESGERKTPTTKKRRGRKEVVETRKTRNWEKGRDGLGGSDVGRGLTSKKEITGKEPVKGQISQERHSLSEKASGGGEWGVKGLGRENSRDRKRRDLTGAHQ